MPVDGEGHQSTSAQISESLRQIIELSHRFEDVLQRSLNVNSTDLQAMEHLIRDRELSPGEISRRLHISTAAATQLVDRLVAQGHVSRAAHPSDRRRVVVRPADSSVAKAMSGLAPMIEGLAIAIDDLSEPERRVVASFLRQVTAVYARSVQSDAV